jgi:hypothetical protein
MREQAGWKEHAEFMDKLASERFIVLGGPLRGYSKHRTLLIFDTADEATLRERLGKDPWLIDGTLKILQIYRWEILLGKI